MGFIFSPYMNSKILFYRTNNKTVLNLSYKNNFHVFISMDGLQICQEDKMHRYPALDI